MKKNNKIEIKGIFFENIDGLFGQILNSVEKESELSSKEFREKFKMQFEKIVSVFEDQIISSYISNNKFSNNKFISIHCKNQKAIIDANEASFYYFLLYINSSVIIYEKCVEAIKRKRISKMTKLVLPLYGLILRRTEQIVTLLLDGYIDGAMMIWRSMYEYIITLLTIAKENNDEITERYFDHSFKNSKKKVISYNDNHKELKFAPLPKTTGQILEKEEKKLKEKYGTAFLDNEYGWANHLFVGKQKASLRTLEERLDFKRFRPYYLLCCEHAHSNFNGFKHYMDQNKIILPKLLDQEIRLQHFIDPMQFTISVLHEVNNFILHEFSVPSEYNMNFEFLTKIFNNMQGTFDKKNLTKSKQG